MASDKQLNILVVEDSYLLAEEMRENVEALGARCVGPVSTVARGLQLMEASSLDGALLDINLAGGTSAALALALTERGVPLILVTGYDIPMMLPTELLAAPRLNKPFQLHQLKELIDRCFVVKE